MDLPFPKIIHQTWKNNTIPEKWKISSIEWKRLHPTWIYHYTTDKDNDNYVKHYFPQYLETWNKLPYPIQRADMIRYMYLYNMGGVYSDLDIVPTRSLEEYNFEKNFEIYACSSGNTPSVFTNSFMISKPKCDVWLEMLEHIKHYKKWPFTIRHFEIMNSTGPNGYTTVLKKNMSKVSVLPSKLFMRFSSSETESLDCKKIALEEDLFNYPITGNSWHSWDSTILHLICCYYKFILFFIFIFIFIKILQRI